MGIWEFIGSTTETVKRIAPETTPLKNACRTSYTYGSATFTQIDQAVRINGLYRLGQWIPETTPLKNACRTSYTYGSAAFTQIDQAVRINGLYRLGQWIPDDETRSKIGLYTTKFAKNAGEYVLREGFKLIPGGAAFSNIVTKTLKDVEIENLKVERLNMLEDKIRAPPKNFSGGRKLIDGPETHGRSGSGEAVSDNIRVVSAADKNPEDVIRVFMMKEIFCTRFFDDLMVHELARGKVKKLE